MWSKRYVAFFAVTTDSCSIASDTTSIATGPNLDKKSRFVPVTIYSDYDIDLAIENIERNANLLPDPSKNECRKIRITDKSDRPIVYSAMKHDCVLVTEDRLLLKEGRKYVRTMRPEDVPPE